MNFLRKFAEFFEFLRKFLPHFVILSLSQKGEESIKNSHKIRHCEALKTPKQSTTRNARFRIKFTPRVNFWQIFVNLLKKNSRPKHKNLEKK